MARRWARLVGRDAQRAAAHVALGEISTVDPAPELLHGEPEGIQCWAAPPTAPGKLRHQLKTKKMTAVIKLPPLRSAVEGG